MLKRLGLVGGVAISLSGCGLFQGRYYICNGDAARSHFDALPKETVATVESLTKALTDDAEEAEVGEIIEASPAVLESEETDLDYNTEKWRKHYLYSLPGDVDLSVLAIADGIGGPYHLWHVRATTYVDGEEYVCGADLDQASQ